MGWHDGSSIFERFDWLDRVRAATILLALGGAAVSVLATTELFPYRSLNHDEGVYLQQAELLLSGRLFLDQPVEDAFRPWFFVESERGLYAKYAPVPAAVFALGRLLGGFPLALAGVSGAIVALTAGVGRELFDARTGLLAGLFVIASPLFLVHSGVYLPYALTAAFELTFALAYLRAERTGSRRAAAAAGVAIGIAFFARPYTALLFGLPFVVHACITLARSGAWRTPFRLVNGANDAITASDRALLTRRILTASLGSAGVAVALGYNALVTGDPLVFPYEAFAPADGIGFGHRQILGHETNYTLSLALEANSRVLALLFTEWVVAGALGTALAAAGLLVTARDRLVRDDGEAGATERSTRPALVAALFLTIPAGNVAFWGNHNVLGRLSVPDDGLVQYLGPYYHYDLLVPTALFAAVAVVAGTQWLNRHATTRFDARTARQLSLAALVISATLVGAVAATTAEGPVSRNGAVSEELAAGYAPMGELNQRKATVAGPRGPDAGAVVFLPTPYGPWLNHPFQLLRNDGEFAGSIYALGDTRELAVADTFPEKPLYRYVFRGSWNPTDGVPVTAELRQVQRVSGERLRLGASLGLPSDAESVTLRVGGETGSAYYVANSTLDRLRLTLTIADGRAELTGPNISTGGSGDGRVAVAERDELVVEVFVSTGPGAGSGFSYRLSVLVAEERGQHRALSPTVERCPVPDRCVPVGLGESPGWAVVETNLQNESA
ncbi:MAG: glycosyltransferase family 39 protein [Halolamina sp.]|uniref:ArnT family glycosyltransferase n=1 Tax=Halolamina sp. TaxID=1940283 RepID=UPI002FC3C070